MVSTAFGRNMQQKLLDAKILTKRRGRLVLNPRWEWHAQVRREVWQRFQDEYDWCDGGVREQIYCLLNDITEPQGCRKCHSFVTFNTHRNRYNNYCSKRCVHTVDNISVPSATLT